MYGDTQDTEKILKNFEMVPQMIKNMDSTEASGSYGKMGFNASLLVAYIDRNLAKTRQLYDTANKTAVLEYMAYLENLRCCAQLKVKAADLHHFGESDQVPGLLAESAVYKMKAQEHLKRSGILAK